jgi:hypothetical protein
MVKVKISLLQAVEALRVAADKFIVTHTETKADILN